MPICLSFRLQSYDVLPGMGLQAWGTAYWSATRQPAVMRGCTTADARRTPKVIIRGAQGLCHVLRPLHITPHVKTDRLHIQSSTIEGSEDKFFDPVQDPGHTRDIPLMANSIRTIPYTYLKFRSSFGAGNTYERTTDPPCTSTIVRG